MLNIKSSNKEEIKKMSTSELARRFNNLKHNGRKMSQYLSSNEVRYCDASNTFQEICETENENLNNRIKLSVLNDEIVSRVNKYGKGVDFYDKDGNILKSYVLPKTNAKNDEISFLICEEDKSYAIHKQMYSMYSKNDIKNLGYKIDRKEDGSINWKDSFIKYDYVSDYSDGGYMVKYGDKYGFVTLEDVQIIPIKYDDLYIFDNHFAKAKSDDKWAIIDMKENKLTDFKYDLIKFIDFEEKGALFEVAIKDEENEKYKFGIIDKDSNVIIPIEYDYFSHIDSNLFIASLKRKEVVFDTAGNIVVPLRYDCISYINKDIVRVYTNNKAGLFNINDKEEIVPPVYSEIKTFDEDLIEVCLNKKYGLLDKKGNIVVPIKYDDLTYFDDEVIIFRLGGERGFINRNGSEVTFLEK